MNIDDNYLDFLEKEIRVQESIKAAKKAYRETVDGMLEKEIRVQESIKAAKRAQQEAEEQLLGNEVRVQESMKAARNAYITALVNDVNGITNDMKNAESEFKSLDKEYSKLKGWFNTITDSHAIKPAGIFDNAVSLASDLEGRYKKLNDEAKRLNDLIFAKLEEAKSIRESALVTKLVKEQADVQKMLFSINTAKKDVSEIAIALDEYEAAIAMGKKHRRIISIIAVAASFLFIAFGTWQYDIGRTYSAGEYGLGLVIAKDANEIQSLIEDKEYDQALELINEELARPFNPENYPDKDQAKRNHYVEEQDLKLKKASILLMQGKKKEAKEILKTLNAPEAKEILDKLFLPW